MPVLTGTAGSATSYADAEGDANTLGHIVSVGAAEGPGGAIVVTVDVANHRTLPPSSSFSAQFDVDASPGTGNAEGARGARRVRALERISIDVDDDPATGDSGAELRITSRGMDVVGRQAERAITVLGAGSRRSPGQSRGHRADRDGRRAPERARRLSARR